MGHYYITGTFCLNYYSVLRVIRYNRFHTVGRIAKEIPYYENLFASLVCLRNLYAANALNDNIEAERAFAHLRSLGVRREVVFSRYNNIASKFNIPTD